MAKVTKKELKVFQEYCWLFYGPGEIYGAMFGNKLEREVMDAACLLRSISDNFAGDSFDRECARDLVFLTLGLNTEHFNASNKGL